MITGMASAMRMTLPCSAPDQKSSTPAAKSSLGNATRLPAPKMAATALPEPPRKPTRPSAMAAKQVSRKGRPALGSPEAVIAVRYSPAAA